MRRFCIVFICMGALCLTACDSTAPTSTQPPAGSDLDAGNLLRDPGFEDGDTAWERILGPQLGRFVATERVHSGEHSLAIQASTEAEALVFQTVPVEGGAVYEASGWVLTESAGGGGASILLQWIDDRSVVVKEETIDVLFGTNFWIEMALLARAPQSATTLRFVLQLSADPDGFGGAWFDDLSLFYAGPPLVTQDGASSSEDSPESGGGVGCVDCPVQACDTPGECGAINAPTGECVTDDDCGDDQTCIAGNCYFALSDVDGGAGTENGDSDIEPVITGLNLLANPGFESGDLHWQRASNGNVESEVIHSGNWALEVPVAQGRILSIYQDVPVYPSGQYQVSGWVWAIGAEGGGLLMVQWLNDNDGVISASVVGSEFDAKVWRLVNSTLTAPSSAVAARVTLRVMSDQDGEGAAIFDDASIVLLDAPGLCNSDAECDDGNLCNGDNYCQGGVCRSGSPINCNDLNPCTDDQCVPALGCVFTADDNNFCDDRLLCNGPDQCVEGLCVPTEPEGCDVSEECEGGQCEDPGEEGDGEEDGGEEGDGEEDGGGGGGGGSGGSGEENLPSTAGTGSIFVDDNGSQQPGYDSGLLIGSANRPFSSLQSAANVVLPGDTVFIRGGIYYSPDNVFATPVLHVGRSGTAAEPVRFESYQDEKVIFDGRAVLSANDNGNRRGIFVPGNVSYVEISGIVIRNAFREGIMVSGQHVTVEDCIVENCGLNTSNAESLGIKFDFAQFFAARRCVVRHCYSGLTSKNASDGLYEDCLVYNCGFTPGGTPIYPENANGIGTAAARNGSDRVRMVRCVSFGNLDDQIDMGHSRDCSAEGCIVFNGNAQNIANGDGWGFKVGNDQDEPVGSGRECRRNLVRYCISFNNKSNGFDARDAIDGVFYNNMAYGNRGQFGISTGSPGHVASYYNNLAWGNDQQDVFVGDEAKIGDYNNWANGAGQMLPSGDQHSIRANPGFANPDAAINTSWQQFATDDVRGIVPTLNHIRNQVAANFVLTNTSPSTTSIDRGTFIAKTTSTSAQTTQINVNQDPTRIFRIGDTIQIEGGGLAQIVSMNATDIFVDTPVSFVAGAGLHLPFSGAAPDMGASEQP